VVTYLFCAWLAWCRFRVVLPLADKTLPTATAAIVQTLRAFGRVPTYALTDNEKTVTVEHVAGIAVRNLQMLVFAQHYGLTIADGDLAAIPTRHAQATPGPMQRAGEGNSLAQGTAGWAGLGEPGVN
jgi:hypothetical protein